MRQFKRTKNITERSNISVNNYLKDNNLDSKLVLQIHDELLFKVNKKEKELVYNEVKKIMESCYELKTKLTVKGGFGVTWYDAK